MFDIEALSAQNEFEKEICKAPIVPLVKEQNPVQKEVVLIAPTVDAIFRGVEHILESYHRGNVYRFFISDFHGILSMCSISGGYYTTIRAIEATRSLFLADSKYAPKELYESWIGSIVALSYGSIVEELIDDLAYIESEDSTRQKSLDIIKKLIEHVKNQSETKLGEYQLFLPETPFLKIDVANKAYVVFDRAFSLENATFADVKKYIEEISDGASLETHNIEIDKDLVIWCSKALLSLGKEVYTVLSEQEISFEDNVKMTDALTQLQKKIEQVSNRNELSARTSIFYDRIYKICVGELKGIYGEA